MTHDYKRNLLILTSLILLAGCSDDSGSSNSPTACDPACTEDQICNNGVCEPKPVCNPACTDDQVCNNGVCEPKNNNNPNDPNQSGCNPACKADETCDKGVCKPNGSQDPVSVCDPECPKGKTCIDGKCAICIGKECFFEGSDDEDSPCTDHDDCEEGKYCIDGNCQELGEEDLSCDPPCTGDTKCMQGKCVEKSNMLWDLCNNQVDCNQGDCIYYLSPSKEMQMEVNGEIQTYNVNNPIPVSVLDSRINVENYNKTHGTEVDASDTIGICTYECTKESESTCPKGWSCQLAAKGILSYPETGDLPFALKETDLVRTPFAAICRPDIPDGGKFNQEMCNGNEASCKGEGVVFYHGMCLETCEETKDCALMFDCQEVDANGGAAKACVPVTRTCTSCYDNDGDNAGFGHCENQGIDCDDNNPDAYYGKVLSCDDIINEDGEALNLDLNCNGYIDRFELIGTVDNCNTCGNKCKEPQSKSITVTCEATDPNLDPNWYKSATKDTELPQFGCVEQCAFGYGDCGGNAKCTTALLTSDARDRASKVEAIDIFTSDVNHGDTAATVYGIDKDGDGFPAINNAATVASKTETTPAEIVLNADSTLICCSEDTNYCYTANKDWKSKTLASSAQEVTNEDGTTKIVSYVKPGSANTSCNPISPSCYDSDDDDKDINPNQIDICDGKDNDGTTILTGPDARSCEEYCALPTNAALCATLINNDKFIINGYCDATPDGSQESKKYLDVLTGTEAGYHEKCQKRHETGEVCNENGIVECQSAPVMRCAAGSENCSCGIMHNYNGNTDIAYLITATNTTTDPETGDIIANPNPQDYVRYFKDATTTEFCHCNSTRCNPEKDGDCEGKDSYECYERCGLLCTEDTDYALTCTADANNSDPDGLVNGEIVFDGKDDNCNGLVDEDAWLPCLITANGSYESLKKGVPLHTEGDMNQTNNYVVFTSQNASDYQKYVNPGDSVSSEVKKFLNPDKSINICRIGILKGVQVTKGNETTYEGYCFPIYQPRAYDFYGDGFDSNCDGVDYDTKNAVFVTYNAQGTIQGDQSNSCKYPEGNGKVTPCSTINGAIAHAKDANKDFYHDIFVSKTTFPLGNTDDIKTKVSPIRVPVLSQPAKMQALYHLSADGLADETGMIANGHFISGYAFHKHLLDRIRQKSTFDPNKYLFTYDTQSSIQTVDGITYSYTPAPMTEKDQPEEVIRIYGGFTRSSNTPVVVKSDNDYWQVLDNDDSSDFDWTIVPYKKSDGAYRKVYSMVSPESDSATLSVLLSHLKFTMASEDGIDLPLGLVDGVTFIGIDGSKGARHIHLDRTSIDIKVPNGYSYPNYNRDDATTRAATGRQNSKGPNASRKEDDHCCDSGYKSRRADNYSQLTYDMKCGYILEDYAISASIGGFGGYQDTCKCYSTYSGMSSTKVRNKQKDELDIVTPAGGGTLWYDWGGCDDNAPHDDYNNYTNSQGKNGNGGANGENGKSERTVMSFNSDDPDGLWVKSDRTQARGYYGIPGAGGGGGSVYRCWEGNGSDSTKCYAGHGGDGGCGGQGGAAGGTGGSALGIVMRSLSNAEGAAKLTITQKASNPSITVTNSSGGKAQTGGHGGSGSNGGNSYGYAREGAFSADTQCQGMGRGGAGGGGGAGGAGGGGRAGWAYPFVMLCDQSLLDGKSFDLHDLDSLKNCGFEVMQDWLENPSSYASQNLTGKTYGDSTESTAGGLNGNVKYQRTTTRGKWEGNYFKGGDGSETPAAPSSDQFLDNSCKLNSEDDNSAGITVMMEITGV